MTVAFANIFTMERETLRAVKNRHSGKDTSTTCSQTVVEHKHREKGNTFHPTFKVAAKTSETDIIFLGTKVTDLIPNLSLPCKCITNLRRPFNARISHCSCHLPDVTKCFKKQRVSFKTS